MAWFNSSAKYALKAFFGGCLGCLGALSATLVLAAVFGLTLGPSVLSALQGIQLPSLPIPGLPESLPPSSGAPLPGLPESPPPSSGAPPAPDCYVTIEAWVSHSEFGSPATVFSRTDGIFPVVSNPTDCGPVSAKLLGPNDEVIMEKSYSVKGGGRNGYGDFNPGRDLSPGSYAMQFWYGENLVATIPLTVQ